jgi:hypothetical protein
MRGQEKRGAADLIPATRGCSVFKSPRGSSESNFFEVPRGCSEPNFFEVPRGCGETHPGGKDETVSKDEITPSSKTKAPLRKEEEANSSPAAAAPMQIIGVQKAQVRNDGFGR